MAGKSHVLASGLWYLWLVHVTHYDGPGPRGASKVSGFRMIFLQLLADSVGWMMISIRLGA